MSVEMTEKTGASVDAPPASERLLDEHETRQPVSPAPDQRSSRRRRLLIGVLCVVALAVLCVFGIPWFLASLNIVSTDDAYVSGHVTFVAPRVAGQISRVWLCV